MIRIWTTGFREKVVSLTNPVAILSALFFLSDIFFFDPFAIKTL
jgi:hypothetical protein